MGNYAVTNPKAMTQRGNDVSNIYPFLPKLTMNGQFIPDFIAAESPCFALGPGRRAQTDVRFFSIATG